MKDWFTLEPDVYALVGGHRHTKGRGGQKIEYIVIHHNAGINSTEQLQRFWNGSREASAHYQVESSGRIGQLVNDWDTAWHADNASVNRRTIGIEVSNCGGPADGWPITDKAVEEAAHLVAALCLRYALGRPNSGANVRYHREFSSTSCPETLAPGGKHNHTLITRAQYWYDQMKAGNTGSTRVSVPAPRQDKPLRYWPLKRDQIRITSRFAGRINPVTGRAETHSGTDFGAPDGTPFYACQSGTVQYIGEARGYGQWIVIDSDDSEGSGCFEYGHMWNAYSTGLKVGDKVKAGQVIGYVGSNGQSTGPHLHLTVWERGYGGKRIDPETKLAGAAYVGEKTSPKPPGKGALMALTDAEQAELLDKVRKIHHEMVHEFQSRYKEDGELSDFRDTLVGYVLEMDKKIEDIHKNMLPTIWKRLTGKDKKNKEK